MGDLESCYDDDDDDDRDWEPTAYCTHGEPTASFIYSNYGTVQSVSQSLHAYPNQG